MVHHGGIGTTAQALAAGIPGRMVRHLPIWIGRAGLARPPWSLYNPGRHRDWYAWWEYSGGPLANDASHQLDLARLALGDPAHPKAVHAVGGNFAFGSQRPTPELQVITYEYDDFILTCESSTFPPYMTKSTNAERFGKQWPFWPQNNERIEIYGTRQMMYLGRQGVGWQVLEGGGCVVAEDKGYSPDRWHQPNFVDCIRSRKAANADIEASASQRLPGSPGEYRLPDRECQAVVRR
jgi:predicted dehydrogenase